MTITDLFGHDNADWMTHPGRPCNPPINSPEHIRTHTDQWFPRERYEDAATVRCAGCPVINQCLAYAMNNPELEGIWGGTTPKQRATHRRAQQKKRAAKKAAA